MPIDPDPLNAAREGSAGHWHTGGSLPALTHAARSRALPIRAARRRARLPPPHRRRRSSRHRSLTAGPAESKVGLRVTGRRGWKAAHPGSSSDATTA